MVIRVHGVLAAERAVEQFNGAVGDDFIGIHIGLSA